MTDLTTEKAKSMVKKTWTKAMGKDNPKKEHFKKVINEFYSSRKDEINELYNLLKPFINRVKKLKDMALDDLIIETNEDKERRLRREKFEKSRGNYLHWEK